MPAGQAAYEIDSEKVKHRAECRAQNEIFAPVPSFLQGHTSIDSVISSPRSMNNPGQCAEKTWENYLKIMSRQPKKRQRKRSHERAPRGADGAAQSLAARFEQQVLRHGERIAVKSKNQSLTYDQLNRAANRLARAILSAPLSSSEPIALLFKQGAALITANLAVLKTGRPMLRRSAESR